ncbi:hypothetical protein GMA11_07035 [Granulicatella sp. zg-ZJ]|uniref:hypothetical protein n=1 Tax=Granulicatella sp. zg-ZJ TaxID=2678504 RepID=UPI0013D228EB|nr:hypothetical protein [Granulicatella sp. zg-ZJ]NEW62153.1 hypothetical protein [Granulicatella sp. zg-ZJ]NEW63148.1 hypothetical protein [Granulicatella sp. zg-ZJ]
MSLYAKKEDSHLTLYVNDAGHQEEFDLTLFGNFKYYQLLDDLRITGEKSSVTHLNVLKEIKK